MFFTSELPERLAVAFPDRLQCIHHVCFSGMCLPLTYLNHKSRFYRKIVANLLACFAHFKVDDRKEFKMYSEQKHWVLST